MMEKYRLFGNEFCGKCSILKKKLTAAGIEFEFESNEELINDIQPEGWHIPFLDNGKELLNFADTCKWLRTLEKGTN